MIGYKKTVFFLTVILFGTLLLQSLTIIYISGFAVGRVSLCVNHFPVLEDMSVTYLPVGENLLLQVNASDEDSDSIEFFDDTTLFDINRTTGLISYTYNDTNEGNHSVTITASDIASGCPKNTSESFVLVIGVHRPVCLTIPDFSSRANQEIEIKLSDYFSDLDLDNLTYNASSDPNVLVTILNGVAYITSQSRTSSSSTVVFSASDGVFSVNSNPVNVIFTSIESPRGGGEVSVTEAIEDENEYEDEKEIQEEKGEIVISKEETLNDVNGMALGYNRAYSLYYGVETHSLTMTKITEESVTITIQSSLKIITLLIGETKYIDINDDGTLDIAVTLNSICPGQKCADIKFRNLNPDYVTDRDITNETNKPLTEEPRLRDVLIGDIYSFAIGKNSTINFNDSVLIIYQSSPYRLTYLSSTKDIVLVGINATGYYLALDNAVLIDLNGDDKKDISIALLGVNDSSYNIYVARAKEQPLLLYCLLLVFCYLILLLFLDSRITKEKYNTKRTLISKKRKV